MVFNLLQCTRCLPDTHTAKNGLPLKHRERDTTVLFLRLRSRSLSFQPSVCFTYYVEPDDPESEPPVAPDAPKSDPNCTVVPLPVLEFREVKVCECPLCCLSFVTAS